MSRPILLYLLALVLAAAIVGFSHAAARLSARVAWVCGGSGALVMGLLLYMTGLL